MVSAMKQYTLIAWLSGTEERWHTFFNCTSDTAAKKMAAGLASAAHLRHKLDCFRLTTDNGETDVKAFTVTSMTQIHEIKIHPSVRRTEECPGT